MSELLTTKEIAKRLKVNTVTINRWRKEENPVPFLQVGRQFRYEMEKVIQWLEDKKEVQQ